MKKVEVIKGEGILGVGRNGAEINLKRVAAYCRVSTDSEDQLQSYHSQVKYYTDLINENPDWTMAGIYADEAITGTQIDKRLDFQRLINDCMNGDIDMVITKSISRFARNTLDTLKYVRHLKEINVAVFFEEENINTLTMDGELLLVILSSVAQQEVENISANVKKGLKMKMQRGELVGFHGCLGYDYGSENKTISINEDEAEIVKYIFRRYLEGAGGSVICRELENLGHRSPRGSSKWSATTVLGIIKNEKYKGDLLMGKTFTLDPITKRRLENFGEEDKFYIKDHHEGIISEEDFDKAQVIRLRRAKNRNTVGSKNGKRDKFSRKYAFSCLLECGFCGSNLSRRSWHSKSQYKKTIWQCVRGTKKGKKFCPNSKGIEEIAIEKAFLESYRQLTSNNKDIVSGFLELVEASLNDKSLEKSIKKLEREITHLLNKQNSLVDLRLEEKIEEDLYEEKYLSLQKEYSTKKKEKETLEYSLENNNEIKSRMKTFKSMLERKEILKEFDRYVFESIVEKVIVGEIDDDGKVDPYKLTFVYKTGFKDGLNGEDFRSPRKNAKKNKTIGKDSAELSSYVNNPVNKSCSHTSDATCGECSNTEKEVDMVRYLKLKKNMVIISTILVALRQGLGVLGAAINAFALTALVKLDIKEFLLQEVFLLLVWTFIIGIEGFLKVYNTKIVQEIDIEIRKEITTKFVNSKYEEFNSRSIGTYLSWLNNDIQTINQKGLMQYFEIVKGISGLVFSVIALLMYHWSLLVVTMISVSLMLIIPKVYKSKIESAGLKTTKANEIFVNKTENILFGFNVFYNFSKMPLMVKRIVDASKELKDSLIFQSKIESIVFTIGFFANIFFQIALTAYTGYLAFLGLVPIGTIEATGALNGVIFTSLGDFTNQISSINSIKPIFKKFETYETMDIKTIIELENDKGEIFKLENLSYSYGDTKVFENLNYRFLRNKKYLISGDSGSGKSTILKAMFGYLSDYEGYIYFNGNILNDYNRTSIRKHVLYINQESYLFSGTIRENINLDDNFSDEDILKLLYDLSFPISNDELNTEVGDRGLNLSGGQRQRIVLARGLIRNQNIVFIDEGTSALDKKAALQIEKHLLENPNLTVIMVSHNPHSEISDKFDYICRFLEDLK